MMAGEDSVAQLPCLYSLDFKCYASIATGHLRSMMQLLATILFTAIIAGLFYLDRDDGVKTSKMLWIPIIWMLIAGSRQMSVWFNASAEGSVANRFTESNTVDAAAAVILIAAALLVLNFRARKVTAFLRVNAPVLLLLFYCALSVLWSDAPIVAFRRWIKGAGVFAMVLVVLTDINPQVAVKRFFSRTSFLLLPLSVLFILFYPNLGTFYDSQTRILYYIGVTTQKNELGLTCLVCGLGSLWSFLGAYQDRAMVHRGRHLFAHGFILVTALWLIKTCDSMTSMSCLVIAGTVMFMATYPWIAKRPGNIHILLGSAIALALFAAFIDSSGVLLRLLGRNATLTGRTEIWKAVLSFDTNPLFGIGFESFWLHGRIEKVWQIIGYKGIAEAHNGYLETYITLGWVGLLLLGMVLVSGYRMALSALRSDANAGRLKLALLTAALIYNVSEAGFKMMAPLWFALLLEITAVPVILHTQERARALDASLTPGKVPGRFKILR